MLLLSIINYILYIKKENASGICKAISYKVHTPASLWERLKDLVNILSK